MQKHTAGPWEVMPESWAVGHVDISSKTRGALAVVVVKMEGAEKNDPEGEANAQLIGAAPELLAELNTVAFHLRRDDFKNNESLRQQALGSIEAIILLATGSAS